jgi:hypothetical protein
MMTPASYKKIVQLGAIYDLLATAALAVPFLSSHVLTLIQRMDGVLGFGTVFLPLDSTALFLINLGGCAYVVWALARLRAPVPELGRLDALLRLAIVLCQIWAVAHGATPILLGLAVILIAIGMLELWSIAECPSNIVASR